MHSLAYFSWAVHFRVSAQTIGEKSQIKAGLVIGANSSEMFESEPFSPQAIGVNKAGANM